MNGAEEGSRVAASTVDALRGNPLCLAVVALVMVLEVIAYLRDNGEEQGRAEIVMSLIDKCQMPRPRTP